MGCSPNKPHNKLHASQLLLTSLILAQFLLSMVCAASVHHYEDHVTRDLQEAVEPRHRRRHHHGDSGVERKSKLYSLCSQQFVRVPPRNKKGKVIVSAKGSEEDPYAKLLFKSTNFNSQLTIQSEKTKEYLCFNRRGRLVTKKNGRRKKMCQFTELVEHHYSRYRSVGDPKFFLGFRKGKGRALQGEKWTKKSRWRECSRFLTPNHTTHRFAVEGDISDSSDWQPNFQFDSLKPT